MEFNSVCGECYRSPKTLRSKYENIKKCSKKKFSDERAYLRGTCGGGGGEKTTSSSEIQSDLQQILGNQMTSFNSEFDDDRNLTIPGSVMNSNSNSGMILASNTELKPINVVLNWSECIPDMLRSRPSAVLEPASQQDMFENWHSQGSSLWCGVGGGNLILKKGPLEGSILHNPPHEKVPCTFVNRAETLKDKGIMETIVGDRNYSGNLSIQKEVKGRARNLALQDKLAKWVSSKTNLVGLQEERMRKEHNLKIQLMNSRHKNSFEMKKRESDLRIDLMIQKHAKEMELLDLKLKAFQNKLK
ncbi:hypothetical protein QTP88_007747 [Uroleucon formosanum]